MAIYLIGIGHYHPKTCIPNQFFESLDIDTNDAWIEERTGIRQRYSVLGLDAIHALRHGQTSVGQLRDQGAFEPIEEGASPAWEIAWQRSHLQEVPAYFSNIICGTSVPDWHIPANAAVIAAKIGIQGTCFDVNSACSSFVVNLHVLKGLGTVAGTHHVIVNPERYSLAMDFRDRASCVLFGDATTLCILASSDHDIPGSLRLEDTVVHSDPSGHGAVTVQANKCFQQNGRVVQKFAVSKTVAITQELLERNGMTIDDVTYFTGHQANLRMLESAIDKLGFRPEQHIHNIEWCGNQGAAGAPSVLSMNWDRFQAGDRIAVAVVGSGLTWGAALFRRV